MGREPLTAEKLIGGMDSYFEYQSEWVPFVGLVVVGKTLPNLVG